MEGPRGLRSEEMVSLRHLTDICFWKGLVDKYPQLFNEDNLENLRVIVDGGEVISHVGMTEQWVSIFGCLLRVACVGAVCTHPNYRMRGLATRLFNDACKKAYNDGVDFMLVSGIRGLYLRAGCRQILGCDFEVSVTPEHIQLLSDPAITVKPCSSRDIEVMSAIYRREPVRFLRRLEDYQRAFACRHVMDKESEFLLILKDGSPRAYVILPSPSKKSKVRIGEYAGERSSLVNALGLILQRFPSLEEIVIHILGCDVLLQSLMEEKGLQLRPSNSACTVRIINFTQLMERLRPYFEEVIGYKETRKIRFLEKEGRFIVEYGADRVVIPGRPEAAQLIFGSKDAPTELLSAGGKAGKILREVLPIPLPWYGINFV